MNNYDLKIVSTLRHWRAMSKSDHISCELCDDHATFSSSLVDTEDVVHVLHWHCDRHTNEITRKLEKARLRGIHIVVHPRHWMHIWKVGYTPCADCRADSRQIATFLNEHGVVIDQKNYCNNHAPKTTRGAKKFINSNDPISQLTFGLGFSIEAQDNDDENE